MPRNEIDAVELAQQTIWEGFRLYAEAPGTSIIENDCVRAVCTGVPYEGFNAAISRGSIRPSEIDDVMGLFRRANVRMLWHVWPADQGIESALLERGLVFYEEEPAMVADLAVETRDASPIDMDIRSTRGLEEINVWVRILSESSNDTFIRRVAEIRGAADSRTGSRFEHLLGLVDGDVVATAGVFHGTRAAEVQHIATKRSHRRRGIGTAMTVAALELVRRQGSRYAVLTASPDGFGIYERLGFKTVATVRRFLGRP
jgi:ribosomal protein S18 acetylase RimI-like enzyme